MLVTFALFAVIQAALYFLATVNTRAIARGKYAGVIASDVALCATSFALVREIDALDSGSHVALAGCIVGGVIGSVSALWLTKRLWRETP